MFYGRGAGEMPTASAVVGDVIDEARNIEYGLSLIHIWGMSYYTGTIFEISMDEFGGSVGGGGRYDKMIGKFTGQDTPCLLYTSLSCSY